MLFYYFSGAILISGYTFFFFSSCLVRIFITSRLARCCLSACACYFNKTRLIAAPRTRFTCQRAVSSSYSQSRGNRGSSRGHFSRDRFSFPWSANTASPPPSFACYLLIAATVNFEKGAFRFSFRVLVLLRRRDTFE